MVYKVFQLMLLFFSSLSFADSGITLRCGDVHPLKMELDGFSYRQECNLSSESYKYYYSHPVKDENGNCVLKRRIESEREPRKADFFFKKGRCDLDFKEYTYIDGLDRGEKSYLFKRLNIMFVGMLKGEKWMYGNLGYLYNEWTYYFSNFQKAKSMCQETSCFHFDTISYVYNYWLVKVSTNYGVCVLKVVDNDGKLSLIDAPDCKPERN
ncbi:hypothetical protein N480_14065 [Pseudoalteromonas luteoviolacea S2607]|uniref:hypothetical protein n=1 Tax=Pseudoalteromonas luteoviolacea TaxID=43657 RepID=UPI0007B08D55|nr:hypothetical protein [Pseudoalteromonas luteoviolacea]KZN37864.1 hypothetical protein N480_14065 [Pseudoalteromonas luteoviolacea S2607]